MVKVSVPTIADVEVDTRPELNLVPIEACGMVVRVKEGKTVRVAGVVDAVLELGLGGSWTELYAEPVEPVLEPGLGGFWTEIDAAPAEPLLELVLWGFWIELDAEPTPGGSCPAAG